MAEPLPTSIGRAPGATLVDGKYRLEAPLAAGGMGSVWRARHTTLDRPVAVKFVDLTRAHGDVAERFLREAMVAAAIRHPNVVDILDFGTLETGEPFMVMELLDGEPLSSRLAHEPPLPTMTAVRIAGQLLSGLDAVHRAGIVHRDLKPANVFLSEDADGDIFARLLDFGISYSVDPASALRRGRFGTDDRLVIGTPEYMAPEQAEGRPDVDARADVYSAAVMLYEMLSGVLPYTAEHPGQLLSKVIVGGAVSLVELRPDIGDIAEVVAYGMEHDRVHRPSTARDFRRHLLAAAGLTGDTTGRFARRSSGTVLKPRGSDRPSAPVVPQPVSREAPTLEQVIPTPTTTGRITMPPASGGGAMLYVGIGIVLALGGVGGYLAMNGSSTAAEVAPAAVVAPVEPTIVEAPVVEAPVAAAPVEAPPVVAPVEAPPVIEPVAAAPVREGPARAARAEPEPEPEAPPAASPAAAADEAGATTTPPGERAVVRELDF